MNAPASTRCQQHDTQAVCPCARCGDFVCEQCLLRFDTQEVCVRCYEAVAVLADPSARLSAYLVNQAVGSVPACLLVALAVLFGGDTGILWGLGLTLLWVFAFVALNLVLLRRHAQTLGKRWMGVRILCSDGSRPTLSRVALLRELVPMLFSAIPLVGTVFALFDVLALLMPGRRALHDMIAGTIVVSVPPARSLH